MPAAATRRDLDPSTRTAREESATLALRVTVAQERNPPK